MTTTEEMLTGLGILGEPDVAASESAPDENAAAASAPSESADPAESETISISELFAQEQADESVPSDDASEDEELESAPDELSEIERIRLENEQLKQEKEALLAADAEEQFEEDWAEVVYDGKAFYQNLINQVEKRAYANGRTRAEVDAVIKHMIYEGNDIERLGAPAGTPGMFAWQEETLLGYANAKAQRGSQQAQPSEIERLTQTYNLTDADQVALRKFANYPPEAREEIAKSLGAKNTQASTRKRQAADVAVANVTKHLTNQTAPGVPGPTPKAKQLAPPRNAAERRQLTELVFNRLGGS